MITYGYTLNKIVLGVGATLYMGLTSTTKEYFFVFPFIFFV